MNDCLLTKLKASVDNEDMRTLGVIKMKVSNKNNPESSRFFIWFSDDTDGTVTINSESSEDYFISSSGDNLGKVLTIPKNQVGNAINNQFGIHAAADTDITIKDNSRLARFQFNECFTTTNDLYEELMFNEIEFINMTSLSKCTVKNILNDNGRKPMNITAYGSVDVIYHDLGVAAYCRTSDSVNLKYVQIFTQTNSTILNREIVNLVAVRRYLGNENGSANFYYPNNFTLNGNNIGNIVNMTVEWTSDKITVYNTENSQKIEVMSIDNNDSYDLDWE